MNNNTQTLLDRLKGVKAGGSGWTAQCPGHPDKEPSLSISEADDKILLHCHAGCSPEAILDAVGLKMADLFTKPLPHPRDTKKIVAEYDYVDREGILLYQTVRYIPKDFRQRRPNDRGGWEWSIKGVKRVLFQLPALSQAVARHEPVYFTEGEKDALRLNKIGVVATTMVGGASAPWSGEYGEALRDADVVVLPDNDSPGNAHAEKIAAALQGTAASVRVLKLPGLPSKGDVSDWLESGGTRHDLENLTTATPEWTPSEQTLAPGPLASEEPLVLANFRFEGEKRFRELVPLRDISADLKRDTNGWPKRIDQSLFVQEGTGVRWLSSHPELFAWIGERMTIQWGIGQDTHGHALTTKPEFLAHLQSAAEPFKTVEAFPHEPPVPDAFYLWQPSGVDVSGDRLSGLLDFFDNVESPHDMSLIKAMFLTPLWGGLPGARPAFVVQAPDRGCGKSTLTEALATLYGGAIEFEPDGRGEDKVLTRLLSPSALSRRIVRIDNIRTVFSSSLLESLITAQTLNGHRLYCGDSTRPNYLTWTMTGNTLQLSRDLSERAFVIRLRKPSPMPQWRERLFAYIEAYRLEIIAEAINVLKSDPLGPSAGDRWQSWGDGVLSRVTGNVAGVLATNQARRDKVDESIDEASLILSYLYAPGNLEWTGDRVFISSEAMVGMVNTALNQRLNTMSVARILNGHIDAKRLPITSKRTSGTRGWELCKESTS